MQVGTTPRKSQTRIIVKQSQGQINPLGMASYLWFWLLNQFLIVACMSANSRCLAYFAFHQFRRAADRAEPDCCNQDRLYVVSFLSRCASGIFKRY
jgi:hypothetical protein